MSVAPKAKNMKPMFIAIAASMLLNGCTTIPLRGTAGIRSFESSVPLAGLVFDLRDSITALGYEVETISHDPNYVVLRISYFSRKASITVRQIPGHSFKYSLNYSFASGVFAIGEDRAREAFRSAIHGVVDKWKAD